MTFLKIIGLIVWVGGAFWLGHWSRRRFGRWGTAIALVAFVAALFVVSWAKHLVGSNEKIISMDEDAVAYRLETPRLPENIVSAYRVRAGGCIGATLGPDGQPIAVAIPCGVTLGSPKGGGSTQTANGK